MAILICWKRWRLRTLLSGSRFAEAAKTLLFTGLHGQVDAADETWAHTASTLQTALRHYGRNLAPLAECGQ